VDVPTLLRPLSARLGLVFPRLAGLVKLDREFRRSKKQPPAS
jgi:hypothetical protein